MTTKNCKINLSEGTSNIFKSEISPIKKIKKTKKFKIIVCGREYQKEQNKTKPPDKVMFDFLFIIFCDLNDLDH